jgi:hypothetical protein
LALGKWGTGELADFMHGRWHQSILLLDALPLVALQISLQRVEDALKALT